MDNYKYVADLIYGVLSSKYTVATALSKFPSNPDNDINLKCAFDALMHYEADEDLRKKIKDYSSLQDDYLEFIAGTISKHKPLPEDIVKRYYKFHKDKYISDNKKGLEGFIDYIKRIINF